MCWHIVWYRRSNLLLPTKSDPILIEQTTRMYCQRLQHILCTSGSPERYLGGLPFKKRNASWPTKCNLKCFFIVPFQLKPTFDFDAFDAVLCEKLKFLQHNYVKLQDWRLINSCPWPTEGRRPPVEKHSPILYTKRSDHLLMQKLCVNFKCG